MRKPRVICLHAFRTSGKILQKMIISRWPANVVSELDLVFPDAPYPAEAKSEVEGIFDPPYFEWYKIEPVYSKWFQANKDSRGIYNLEECLNYLEEFMLKHGPFDGVLGFSQGAMLAAMLPGMQKEGVALTKVPKIKFLIIISGAKYGDFEIGPQKMVATAFSSQLHCPSLHIIGELDFLKEEGKVLSNSYIDSVVIYHAKGHIIPKLKGEDHERMLDFIIQNIKKRISCTFSSRM